ncbi:MAG: T9SS type A sorting domain-containing protein [Candidatus Kapaibacterium sp.]
MKPRTSTTRILVRCIAWTCLTVVCVLSTLMPVRAQQSPCKEEIRAWALKEMVPTIRAWKNEFDAKLRPEELSQLDELRIKALPLRQRREDLMKRMAAAARTRDEHAGDALRTEFRELRNDWEALVEQLIPLARAHRDDLVALGEKAKPQAREWRAALREKISACIAAQPSGSAARSERFEGFIRDLLSDDHQETSRMRKRAAARFLLWDGRTLPQDDADAMPATPGDRINLSATFTLSQCSPNPVSGSRTSIRFSLSKTDNVKISVLDIHGSEVDVVADRQFAAGTNVIEVNTASLPNGQYSIRLVCSEGMLYTSMIVSR